MANSVNKFIVLVIVMVYGNCSEKVKPALSIPDRNTFRGWPEYLEIALPAAVMICAEFWFFDVLVLLSGTLSVLHQAAQVILLKYLDLLMMVALGI